jgi:hypothetical protein
MKNLLVMIMAIGAMIVSSNVYAGHCFRNNIRQDVIIERVIAPTRAQVIEYAEVPNLRIERVVDRYGNQRIIQRIDNRDIQNFEIRRNENLRRETIRVERIRGNRDFVIQRQRIVNRQRGGLVRGILGGVANIIDASRGRSVIIERQVIRH